MRPRTPEGKARAASNALKHGLLSRGVLLPDEDADAFAELSRSLSEDLNPVGGLELALVERIIHLYWRLQRLVKVEAGMFAWYDADLWVNRIKEKGYRAQDGSIVEAIRHWEAAKITDLAMRGEIFIVDAGRTNAITKLSRYEISIERSLHKTLHELERHQALRQGKDVPVPLAVDIDVSGVEPGALRITPSADKP